MSFVDDIDVIRMGIPWIDKSVTQDIWKTMAIRDKIIVLNTSLIRRAHEMGYSKKEVMEKDIKFMKSVQIICDIGDDSLLSYYLNLLYIRRFTFCLVPGGVILIANEQKFETLNVDIEATMTAYFVNISYKMRDKTIRIALVYNNKLYRALIDYFTLTSSLEYVKAAIGKRMQLIHYNAEQMKSELKQMPVLEWQAITTPSWFVKPTEDPLTWHRANEEINKQLLTKLLPTVSQNYKKTIEGQVSALLSTGHYTLAQSDHSLLPYFIYLKTNKPSLALEIKENWIMISGYDINSRRRYQKYATYKKYGSTDITWDLDLFESLMKFYILETGPEYKGSDAQTRKWMVDQLANAK